MAMLPVAMFGLEVPPGDVAIPARQDVQSAFRITMAAIDPTAEPEGDEQAPQRATLKVLRLPGFDEDDESDEDEAEFDINDLDAQFADRLNDEDSEDSEDEDDEDVNGGPSDPAKSKKALAQKQIEKLLEQGGMDVDEESDDAEQPNGINGIVKSAKAKGKMPASDSDSDEDEDSDDDDEGEIEEFVLCTLDPNKNYQQPVDITFGDKEQVFFKVTGTHSIFLTGNYVQPEFGEPDGMYDPDSDDEMEYDMPPDADELDDDMEEDSEDDLDDLEDPRVVEVIEEEEVAPALIEVKADKTDKKSSTKTKRPAPDDSTDENEESVTLDEIITKAAGGEPPKVNGEQKLSKSQKKKLKKNNGVAAVAPESTPSEQKETVEPPSSNKSDKKVSFAKELEQGPTPAKDKAADKEKKGPALGVKIVQGVTIDDRKLGTGQAAKNGDRISMRYIGKLQSDNKVFDSNKKGKPFGFKLGTGEVIKGWDIGVQGMQAGGERRLTVPAHLAYGSKKSGPIPANSTLIFDVKLLDINRGK